MPMSLRRATASTHGPHRLPSPRLLPASPRWSRMLGELGHHPDLHYVITMTKAAGLGSRFIWILDSIRPPPRTAPQIKDQGLGTGDGTATETTS